ncbi:zinc finger protein Aiolos-like [Patiria miniata]|uniref:C2H2-type domain-containing protein n=1 Tax=Patiria miniata TaxID=46514 RepID=A0A914BD23_PATMI|nr:zinc finger protein Aiolos-like [Patiria miniata]
MESQRVEDQPCVILEDDEDTHNLSPKSEPHSPFTAKVDHHDDRPKTEERREDHSMTAQDDPSLRFKCSDCNFCSDSSHQLEKHIRTHTGERPYCCSICGFAFSQKGNLNRHFRTHSDERPFQCPVCQYSARRKDALIAHLDTHRQERLNVCPFCNTAYKQKASLKYHLKRCGYQKMGGVLNQMDGHGSSSTSDPFSLYEGIRMEHGGPSFSESLRSPSDVEVEAIERDHGKRMKFSHDEESSRDSSQDRNSGITDTASNEDLEKALSNVMQMYGSEICLTNRATTSLEGNLHVTPTITAVYSQAPMDTDRMETQNSQLTPKNHPPARSQMSPSASKHGEYPSAVRYRGTIDLNKTRDFVNKSMTSHGGTGGGQGVASQDGHDGGSETSESNDSVSHYDESIGSSSHGHSRQKPHSSTRPSGKIQDKADSTEAIPVKSPVFDSPQHRNSRRTAADEAGEQLCTNCRREMSGADNFKCEHCEIIFLDHVMYTIHMGCHGFRDPFECNICGHQCKDRYEFASHLARGKHL